MVSSFELMAEGNSKNKCYINFLTLLKISCVIDVYVLFLTLPQSAAKGQIPFNTNELPTYGYPGVLKISKDKYQYISKDKIIYRYSLSEEEIFGFYYACTISCSSYRLLFSDSIVIDEVFFTKYFVHLCKDLINKRDPAH